MDKYKAEAILQEIIGTIEDGPDYDLELALKDTLEDLHREDDFDAVSATIAGEFDTLIKLGIDLGSLIYLMDARGLISNLDMLFEKEVEIDPIIARAIAEIGDKKFHDELLESAKTWLPYRRFDKFSLLKKYLSTSEIANLLFGNYERLDCEDCDLQHSENREEIAEIAIKENRVCDFVLFVYPDFYENFTNEILPYIKSLIDKGADKKALLKLILQERNISNFEEDCLEKLKEYGFDLALVPDEVMFLITRFCSFLEVATWQNVDLGKIIESLSEENQKKLFAEIDPDDIEELFFYKDPQEWISRFYLTNAPKIEGSMPLLYMEAIPVEELISHKRSSEFKEYLKKVISGEDESYRVEDDSVERAEELLVLFAE